MMAGVRFKRKLQLVMWPVLGLSLVAYFLLHSVNGNHGMIARQTLTDRIISAEAALTTLKSERQVLERRAKRLSPETLDLDMLDERIRVMLDYSHPSEVIIYRSPDHFEGPDTARR
jgi:cell division protein FtsB